MVIHGINLGGQSNGAQLVEDPGTFLTCWHHSIRVSVSLDEDNVTLLVKLCKLVLMCSCTRCGDLIGCVILFIWNSHAWDSSSLLQVLPWPMVRTTVCSAVLLHLSFFEYVNFKIFQFHYIWEALSKSGFIVKGSNFWGQSTCPPSQGGSGGGGRSAAEPRQIQRFWPESGRVGTFFGIQLVFGLA